MFMLPTVVPFRTRKEANAACAAFNGTPAFWFVGHTAVKVDSSMGVETAAKCVFVPSFQDMGCFADGTPLCCGQENCTCEDI